MFITLAMLLGGLLMLIGGGEALVRGASRLAALAGIPSLIIGLTVVAFGTSAPELAVSLKAAFIGSPDIALGNVVGSNIFNILLILGVSALIVPLAVNRQLIRLDVPVMIVATVVVWLFCRNGVVGRGEGIALVLALPVYIGWLFWQARKKPADKNDKRAVQGGTLKSIVFIVAGLAMLVLGSKWLVEGASALARAWGVGELTIGLTIVAAGTSLPEVATSIVAAVRGERDIAVGNIVGSNIFNLLAVLGGTALLSGGVNVTGAALQFDVPFMATATFLCLPIFISGAEISRGEGLIFLAFYVGYLVFVVLRGTAHPAAWSFARILWWSFLPVVLLVVGAALQPLWRKKF
ncbi:MAG TPA: calcium/sodium antiporter [bacterium]|nr:calcium/sodium antiporter [bacterium]